MQIRKPMLAMLCAATFAASPMLAADFSLTGSYWNTNVAGKTAGAGVILGLPLNPHFAFELRATYFEKLNDHALENIFHSHDPVFVKQGIQVLPLEAGVRLSFGPPGGGRVSVFPGAVFWPYIGGGLSYFRLDSDFGQIADQLGAYTAIGATVGDGKGADFFFEGLWRKATAHVKIDPQHFSEIEDIRVVDHATFILDGLCVNAGVRFKF